VCGLSLFREGQSLEVDVPHPPGIEWWSIFPMAAGHVIVGVLALLLTSGWPLSRLAFCTCLAVAFAHTPFVAVGSEPFFLYATLAIHSLSFSLACALTVRFAFLFPSRRPPLELWENLLAWFFGLGFAFLNLLRFWIDWPWWWKVGGAESLYDLLVVAWNVVLLGAVTRSYRRTDQLGRRQLKWVLYGFYIGAAPMILVFSTNLAGLLSIQAFNSAIAAAYVGLAAIPAGFLVAVFWSRLLDIDPLVSATTSYSVLSIVVLGGIFVVIPAVAEAAGDSLGIDPETARLGLSVALAAVAVPIHRSLRPRIDQLFFPERHSLELGVERLLAKISNLRDPREITRHTGEGLETLLQPESIVVYALAGAGYEAIFVRGKAVPPVVARRSPLVATLEHRSAPLAADRFSRKDRLDQLTPFDRATLATLGATVIVPLQRRGKLLAFLCLAPKHSGDIYTSTDLALLTAVANLVAAQLELTDQAEVIRGARAMQQELRQYVPRMVANELESGGDLEPRERSVSVLFVDIRGYTGYSATREAHEIFTTINAYTQTVSAIVTRFGGAVVEFNGDGLMAVFGAPRELADKERAAVAAGLEIGVAVQAIRGPEVPPGGISVGVGVATGAAFVGNIHSADRLIWSVLGNTTNLAARLETLTRELNAAMVIDQSTWRAAGNPSGFERREQVAIRGRGDRENLYLLPLVSNSTS